MVGMSKARIIFPIFFALICAGTIIFFLWWQLERSTLITEDTPPDIALSFSQSALTLPEPENDFTAVEDRALYYLQQGDIAALRGDWKTAQQQYTDAVKADGGLAALRKLAQAQLTRRDTDGAIKTLKALRAAGARPQDLLLIETRIALFTGQLAQVKELLSQAESSPQQQYGSALLGILEGNHQAVKDYLQEILKGWDPQLRANARTLLDAYDEFALFPESTNAHLVALLSRALAQVQECEIALPLLRQVTNQEQDYRDAWIVQGFCELMTERTDEAIISFQQAYSLDPQKPETQYFLGRSFAAADDPNNAITFLKYSLLNGFGAEYEVRMLIAEQALKKNDPALAVEQYLILAEKTGPETQSKNLKLYQGLISALVTLKQLEKAHEEAKKLVDSYPQSGRSYELLGWVEAELGQTKEAKNTLKKALELDPYLTQAPEILNSL